MVNTMPTMPDLAAAYATCPIWPSKAAMEAVEPYLFNDAAGAAVVTPPLGAARAFGAVR